MTRSTPTGPHNTGRSRLVSSLPTKRQINSAKAVEEVLKCVGSADQSKNFELLAVNESEDPQQLCPVASLPDGFFAYGRDARPNPLLLQRARTTLSTFKTILPPLKPHIPSNQSLFLPQGVHPTTGQALPPLYNNAMRMATGEDTASLSRTVSNTPFAFQVINNNFNIQSAQPGRLVQQRTAGSLSGGAHPFAKTRHASGPEVASTGDKGKYQRKKQKQLNFTPAMNATIPQNPTIPKSAVCVKDILRWWVRPDLRINLKKPLQDWTVDERNSNYTHKGIAKSNRSRYAKLKTQAMAYFHFCSTHTSEEYEAQFTSLTQKKKVGQNYKKSSEYSKKHNLAVVFKEQKEWQDLTNKLMKRADIKAMLGIL